MPKYIQDQLNYKEQKDLESMTDMEMIKKHNELKHRDQIAKSYNNDKKTV
jgi:hypothetical protein